MVPDQTAPLLEEQSDLGPHWLLGGSVVECLAQD